MQTAAQMSVQEAVATGQLSTQIVQSLVSLQGEQSGHWLFGSVTEKTLLRRVRYGQNVSLSRVIYSGLL